LIEQHREMLVPGQGIVRDRGPTKEYSEFPKHMTHPGFQPGTGDKEHKVMDENGNPTGRVYYSGGRSIRFPPVLVHTEAQEEYHASQGYVTIGKSDAAAFARAVATAVPVPEEHKPIEYPKWSHGKMVNNADEEAEHLRDLGIDALGRPLASSEPPGDPVVNAEANTLEVWPAVSGAAAQPPVATEEEEIAALEARLAALKAARAPIVSMNQTTEPIVMKQPALQASAPTDVIEQITQAAAKLAVEMNTADKDALRAERAAKIKEGKERAKAARETAA